MHIHDYHGEERNFRDILFYRLIEDRSFQVIVYHDQHNHQEINNSIQVENHRIQINEGDHNIDLKMFQNKEKILDYHLLTVNIT
jgi:hypothetical protein